MPATLPQLPGSHCLQNSTPLGPPLAKPPPPATAPRAQPPQPTARNIIHARPAFASTRSQRSWPPMHTAHHRGSVSSAAASLRDSVQATLPQLLRSNCLHEPPPLGSPLADPQRPLQPRPTAPAHNTQHHQRIAGVRKHPLTAQLAADARSVPPRSSDVSCVIPPRLGASDAAPAAWISLSACTAASPARPSQNPPPAPAPRATAPAHSTQHHPCTAGGRMHPLTAQLAADARSVPLRSSDFSCAIPPRLGASDAAPSPLM